MFRIRYYLNKILRLKLTNIEEVIQIESVGLGLIEYFQAFKKSNDEQTCKNLFKMMLVMISQGYFFQQELVNIYGKDFFRKLLENQDVNYC